MKLAHLLDTHAALWWLMEPDRLDRKARRLMQRADAELYVSAASGFEIAQKVRTGKLPYPEELVAQFPALFLQQDWRPLGISIAHAFRAGGYKQSHRDPFDRLLAAQAELEHLTVITRDQAFRDFPVQILWA